MDKIANEINQDRRRFFGAAARAFAATQLGMIDTAAAQREAQIPAVKPGTNTSFGPLKQIDASVLNVGYAEAGPANGPPVILLHGWPYDIYSFVDVAPLLASAGYHVFVPYLRGYGTTRFLSSDTVRNGQPSALAVDAIAFLDSLKMEKAVLAGFDWVARTADIVAALWPERCQALVSVSGYLIGSQNAGKMPLPPTAELEWWYQFYFATERGRAGYDKYRREFSKLIWQLHRNGSSTMPRSIAAPRPSTTRITSLSSSIITAGDSAWPRARRNMTTSKSGWRNPRRLACPPLRSKATLTVRRMPIRAPMQKSSPANTRTDSSRAVSDTTCHRKLRRPLPRLLSTSREDDPTEQGPTTDRSPTKPATWYRRKAEIGCSQIAHAMLPSQAGRSGSANMSRLRTQHPILRELFLSDHRRVPNS